MDATAGYRLALVHDWLTGMRGGEKCLEPVARAFPSAPIYTLIHRRGAVGPAIESHPITASNLNRLPGVARYYRYLLPLMPRAARWKIADCDLLLSLSHCVAKAAVPPPGVPHICYCFTPMRYAWHMREQYFARGPKGWAAERVLRRLRDWDRRTVDRVTHFVAISRTIQRRIRECYGRSSAVIYPPVDVEFYTPAPVPRGDYYLVVSAFAPYKRLDLAIAACRKLGRKLVVIGKGQDDRRLRAQASEGGNIEFLGWQSDGAIRDHMRKCAALLFPGEEDFGIVPLEANACGTPVIAFGAGGVTETIRPLGAVAGPTGVFFAEQSVDALIGAIGEFEARRDRFEASAARANALQFGADRYLSGMLEFMDGALGRGRTAERRAA